MSSQPDHPANTRKPLHVHGTLRIRFCDFQRNYPQPRDYFRRLLGQRYELDETGTPDLVIYSNYGREHLKYDCNRVFYSMENERADYRECDFAITFDRISDARHLRIPYFVMHEDISPLSPRECDSRRILADKTGFCCFVHSNPFGPTRNRLLTRLSKYKHVVSGGRFRNNLGHPVENKVAFMRSFKFAFAFENESYPGYTTEKLADALLANTIPIYWGNEHVGEDFNSAAFLNRHDFSSDEGLIQRIREIDENDELYRQYLAEPAFVGNAIPERFSDKVVLDFLDRAIAYQGEPVARRDSSWSQRRRTMAPHAVARRARRFARHTVKGLRLATGL